MEYSQYIFGTWNYCMTWDNIPCLVMEYFATMCDLLRNQQWFIDSKHIIIFGATNAPNI